MKGNMEPGTKGKNGCDPRLAPLQTELELNAAASRCLTPDRQRPPAGGR
jgi:hypothetical protein